MSIFTKAGLLCLLAACWTLTVSDDYSESSIPRCRTLLRSVSVEVTPTMLQALCRDNSSVTLVVTCHNIVWSDTIPVSCSSNDLSIGEALMDHLLLSPSVTLHLAKAGTILDSANVKIIISEHLLLYRISAWGSHNTRFVLAIARECSRSSNQDSAVAANNAPQTYSNLASRNQFPVHTRNQPPTSAFNHLNHSPNPILPVLNNQLYKNVARLNSNSNFRSDYNLKTTRKPQNYFSNKRRATQKEMRQSNIQKPDLFKNKFQPQSSVPTNVDLATRWWKKGKNVVLDHDRSTAHSKLRKSEKLQQKQFQDDVSVHSALKSQPIKAHPSKVYTDNLTLAHSRSQHSPPFDEGLMESPATMARTGKLYTGNVVDQFRTSENVSLKSDVEGILAESPYVTSSNQAQQTPRKHEYLPVRQLNNSRILLKRNGDIKIPSLEPSIYSGVTVEEPTVWPGYMVEKRYVDKQSINKKRSAENNGTVIGIESLDLSKSNNDSNLLGSIIGDTSVSILLLPSSDSKTLPQSTILNPTAVTQGYTMSTEQTSQTESASTDHLSGGSAQHAGYSLAETDSRDTKHSIITLEPTSTVTTKSGTFTLEVTAMHLHSSADESSVGSLTHTTDMPLTAEIQSDSTNLFTSQSIQSVNDTLATYVPVTSNFERITSTTFDSVLPTFEYTIIEQSRPSQETVSSVQDNQITSSDSSVTARVLLTIDETFSSDLSIFFSSPLHNSASSVAQETVILSSQSFIEPTTSIPPLMSSNDLEEIFEYDKSIATQDSTFFNVNYETIVQTSQSVLPSTPVAVIPSSLTVAYSTALQVPVHLSQAQVFTTSVFVAGDISLQSSARRETLITPQSFTTSEITSTQTSTTYTSMSEASPPIQEISTTTIATKGSTQQTSTTTNKTTPSTQQTSTTTNKTTPSTQQTSTTTNKTTPSTQQTSTTTNKTTPSTQQTSTTTNKTTPSTQQTSTTTNKTTPSTHQTSTTTNKTTPSTHQTSTTTSDSPQTPQPTGLSTSSLNPQSSETSPVSNENKKGPDDDTLWPAVAALVIGVPAIIVLIIAITVIHRKRRLNPSKIFNMTTLNSSSQSSISTPRHGITRQASQAV